MDIICLKCGRHFNDIELLKAHSVTHTLDKKPDIFANVVFPEVKDKPEGK